MKNDWSTNARLTGGKAQNYAGGNDSNTPGYLLLNLDAQCRVASFGDSEMLLFAKGKDMLNENIHNSTSYMRNFTPEPGRSAEIVIKLFNLFIPFSGAVGYEVSGILCTNF
ncbi:MAG: hypothetical protein PHF31_02495 [Methylobacter sp.]|nr:hypothetical protein [Methylobacter sp.]